MTDQSTSGLSAAEEAYFSSGGETEITADPAPVADLAPIADTADPADPSAAVVDPVAPPERDDKGRFVPHQALHAEREEHKKTKAELEQIRQQQAILNDRWQTLLAFNPVPDAQKDRLTETPPDPEVDIFAHSKWQADRLKALENKLSDREKADEEARTAAAADNELWGHWSQSAQAYAATNTDFGDAVKFLSDTRTAQLKALALVDPSFASDQGVLNQINMELKSIVGAARQKGIDPAMAVHELAKAYGFNGAKAPTADPAAADLAGKISQIDAAQNASRTLAASPGKNAGDPLSAEAIASMPTKEFEAWMKVPENASRFQKMMGG